MDTSLAYKIKIFTQEEASENENAAIKSEFGRWEWDCWKWAVIKVIPGYGEAKHYLDKQHNLCFGTSENDKLINDTWELSSSIKFRN